MKQQRADSLPTMLFCNKKDTTDRINVLYKKRPYKLVNNTIGTHLIDEYIIAIEKEIETWYNADEKTFLDEVISTYAGESTFIKQFCVPIKEDN